MIDLNPALGIVFFEALLILSLLALIIPFLRHKKNTATQSAALILIKKLEKNKGERVARLMQVTNDLADIEPGQLSDFLEEIKASEKNFYQHLLRMFFSRDPELLKKIDKKVQSLSEPYHQLLSHSASAASNNDALTQEINRLKHENLAISEQLETAMDTLDEITVEYTKIFSGKRTELELENSSKKMLALFRTSGQRIKKSQQPV